MDGSLRRSSMKSESLERRGSSKRSEDDGDLSIRGMESIVATVSGYHGTERFKLIKLIAYSGANYVGAMSKSTTHLVCWTFEGKKHDLAKKLGTHVVSHRWFEDCLKEGKRLPEDPYTRQSGQEVGSISLDVPSAANACGKKQSPLAPERSILYEHSNPMGDNEAIKTDVGCSSVGCFSWTASHFLNEHRNPSSSAMCLKQRRKSCNGIGGVSVDQPSRKSRRLVKKKKTSGSVDQPSVLDCKQGHCRWKRPKRHENMDLEFSYVDNMMNGVGSSYNGIPAEHVSSRLGELIAMNNLGCINALSDDETNSQDGDLEPVRNEDSVCDLKENQNEWLEDDNDVQESVNLQKSAELSCVICWTEFCSSRGVLPCGHRFCYNCIQGWVDHMVAEKKVPTCPLCKFSIACITKVEGAGSYDQKIYSQTIPSGTTNIDVCMLSDRGSSFYGPQPPDSVCCACQNREPEDLLQSCHLCQVRCIHSYCLDPPMPVWTCIDCRGLRGLLQRYR